MGLTGVEVEHVVQVLDSLFQIGIEQLAVDMFGFGRHAVFHDAGRRMWMCVGELKSIVRTTGVLSQDRKMQKIWDRENKEA